MFTNPMKERMKAGLPAMGVSVMIPSPQIVEMLGAVGFDWVLLDCEHGTMTPESLELMVMAAEAAGITAIARPKTNDPHDIVEVMDKGVAGVQVPHVKNADEAKAAVEAVKFHPLGKRGLAAGTRAARYDSKTSLDDFVKIANAATLVAVQVEDEEALEHAEAIAHVDGVDVVFVGPSDLSQSMGFPGHPEIKEVREAITDVLDAALAVGKIAGLPADTKSVGDVLARGVGYTYTHLPKLLGASAAAHLKAAGR